MLAVIAGLISIVASGLNPAPESGLQDTVILSTTATDKFKILKVNRILIIGNKVTRNRIIERELSLKSGDTVTVARLNEILLKDKNKVYNLRLFNTVSIRSLELDEGNIDLLVEVNERWYTFPSPIFELSDRNFNEWWENYNHDFKRINYGLRLDQRNFRGRNETLRLIAQFGYSRRYSLLYRIPNLDETQKHGLSFGFDYGEPKNLAYFTSDHKLDYLESQQKLKKTVGGNITYSYRRSFYETHSFELEYRNSEVADTIVKLNPNYYSAGSQKIRFASFSYFFTSDHRDVAAYPLKGYYFDGYISRNGLGFGDVNQLEANITFAKFIDLNRRAYLSNFTSLYASSPNSQPYALYSAMGYRKQFIRGYEVYVIEGPKFFLNKTTLKKLIFSRIYRFEEMPLDQFRHFPISIYLKGYADLGYVENYPRYSEIKINNTLSDRLLAGAGTGIDLVLAYDTVIRFEYTFTRENTHGFFFHLKKEF
ncbi:MAG: POTRA domain-containing protein [Bacteroidota bacterium]